MIAIPLIEEILGHLGAARMQTLPTDDRIIAGHVDMAFALAKAALTITREDHARFERDLSKLEQELAANPAPWSKDNG